MRQVSAALVAVHAAGIAHRDLKPSNVLIDAAGNAKISDFGISRFAASEGPAQGDVTLDDGEPAGSREVRA